MLPYEHDDETLYWEYPVPGTDLVLRITARDIRKQPSGLHATLGIEIKDTRLAWGVLNVERDEDRVRMSNSAFARINGHIPDKALGKSKLKNLVDDFSFGLWDASSETTSAVLMAGSEQAQPTDFSLPPYIVKGGGTILFAHPGKGKSFTALLMAVCIDAGIKSFWDVGRAQRVLWINLERSVLSTQNRLGNVNGLLRQERTRPMLTLNARGKSLADVQRAAIRAVREHEVEVVVLDSISRAGMGDLTENAPVNKIIDAMNGLAPTWLGIAHAPRGSDEHLYGSIHFDAGADVLVRLASEQAGERLLGVSLQMMKGNDVGTRAVEMLAYEFDQMGIVGIRRAREREFISLEEGVNVTPKDGFKRLKEYMGEGAAVTVKEAQEIAQMERSWVYRMLEDTRVFSPAGKRKNEKLYVLKGQG